MPVSSPTFGQPCSVPIVTLVRKDGLRIPLHAELVALVSLLMDLTEALGYNIVPGWTWGYACRHINNDPDLPWSNHSKGCAIDNNAPVNPYASADWHRRNARGTFPFGLLLVCDIPQKVVELWEDHGFFWGGRYSTKPDPMHFEFVESVTVCRRILADLIAFLGHPHDALPKPGPKPPPPQEDDEMFTYEYDAPGAAPSILVLVTSKGQDRLTGEELLARRRRAEAHLGPIGKDEFDRFKDRYGAVAGL